MILFSYPSTSKSWLNANKGSQKNMSIAKTQTHTETDTAHGGCLTMLHHGNAHIFDSVLEIMRWFSNLTPIVDCVSFMLFIFNTRVCMSNKHRNSPTKNYRSLVCVPKMREKGIRKTTTPPHEIWILSHSKVIWEIELSFSLSSDFFSAASCSTAHGKEWKKNNISDINNIYLAENKKFCSVVILAQSVTLYRFWNSTENNRKMCGT